MICNRCVRAALRYRTEVSRTAERVSRVPSRNISTTSPAAATLSPTSVTQSAPRQGPPSSSHNPPAATSTGAAQPFSTPLTPSPANQDLPIPSGKHAPIVVKSSVPAGTVLKGLNFIKGKQDPVALADSEYPSWLWGVLSEGEAKDAAGGADEGDLFCKLYSSQPRIGRWTLTVTQRNPRNKDAGRQSRYGSNNYSTPGLWHPRSHCTSRLLIYRAETDHWREPSMQHWREMP